MTKRNKIIYWIAAAWLAAAMSASGLQQLFHTKSLVDIIVPCPGISDQLIENYYS